jgi:ATP-binding cassette, subfamily C (CFTR/MRP), member 1
MLFTSLLDLARVRTQWLLNENTTSASLVMATLLLKVAILTLESVDKYSHRRNREETTSPVERSGAFGWSLLLWLIPLLRVGYVNDLGVDDLLPLDSDLTGELVTERVAKKWNISMMAREDVYLCIANRVAVKKSRKHCLTLAVLRTFAPEIFLSWLPRSAHIGFLLAQPFLVNTMLRYIQNHIDYPISYGYGIIGAYGIVYIGIAVCHFYTYLSDRVADCKTRLRTRCTSSSCIVR